MFFVSITKKKIVDRMEGEDVKEIQYGLFVFTIVTDNFLSRLTLTEDGFSIVESPLISQAQFPRIVFSEVRYKQKEEFLEIFKSTISGRPIYYTLNETGDFFCSTHISMFRRAEVKIEENSEVIPELFVYDFVFPPQTL